MKVNVINPRVHTVGITTFKAKKEKKDDRMFIAMPMIGDDWLEDINNTIKDAAATRGIEARRIDDASSEGSITQNIFDEINRSKYVVADLTGSNPNVYLEMGYAIGKGKTIIPVARKDTKLPFNVQDTHVKFFKNCSELKVKLTDAIDKLKRKEQKNKRQKQVDTKA